MAEIPLPSGAPQSLAVLHRADRHPYRDDRRRRFVPIGYLDVFVPLLSPYRPLWIGLGALAFDMLLAVAITSGLRARIGVRTWRGVHYLAYACWPIASARLVPVPMRAC